MPVSTARAPQFRFNVAVVTPDHPMGQEADACLAADYALFLLRDWTELAVLMKKQRLDAVLLDLDSTADRSEDSISSPKAALHRAGSGLDRTHPFHQPQAPTESGRSFSG